MQESPWIRYKAGREFQAILQDRLEYLFYSCVGPDTPSIYQTDKYFRKGVFSWVRNNAFNLFNRLTKREKPSIPRPSIETLTLSEENPKVFDDWLYEYLKTDWNPVYEELKDTGTLLGALSAYMTGNYNLPVSTVQEMGIEDYDRALKYKSGIGINDLDELYPKLNLEKTMQYAKEYAERDAAIHLAVYDENGERKGRAYEIISDAFRKQISQALSEGKTVSEIQSRLAYPNLRDYLESGKISLDEYNDWMSEYMNRDFNRIALTEASYAFNFGMMRQLSESGRTYLKFMPG